MQPKFAAATTKVEIRQAKGRLLDLKKHNSYVFCLH